MSGTWPGAGQGRSRALSAMPSAGGELLRETEHRQHPTLGAEFVRVTECTQRAQAGSRILGADSGRDPDARPAADPGKDRDVLAAVGAQVGHRVADDARRRLEPPKLLARLGV